MSNYQVDRSKWSQLTINEQMGNIGSEVGRSIAAWGRSDSQRFNGALVRALDLFDATTEVLVEKRSPRVKEVLRSKDQFLALFFEDQYEIDAKNIEDYFFQFAYAARINR